MKNVLTVEVEEYFHDEGFADTDDRRNWDRRASHVRAQTMRLLDLLDVRRRGATFFVLGCVAERERSLVREIADRGHEIASHGMSHVPPDAQTRREFRMDVRKSKQLLEDVVQEPVTGYRAPGFAISRATPWAHEVLAEEGFVYSSSVCPPRIDGGDELGHTTPWTADCGRNGILEMPPLSHRLTGQNVPIAGGSYLRLMPMRALSDAIAAMNAMGAPALLTLRPWEIDDTRSGAQEVSLSRWRHWVGVELFETKMATLLRENSIGSVRDWMATSHHGAEPDAGPQRNERAAV
jgi:polysaccharide deacetylase family protein (PEP-CTERM system associated)